MEKELKELKKLYRDPTQQPPKLTTYHGIYVGKKRSTLLYCTIAASRGRVHVKGWDLEQQQKFVDENLEKLLSAKAA